MGMNPDGFRRRMKAAVLTVLLLCGVLLTAAGCGARADKIRIGTAGIGGNYYSFGQTFAQFLMGDIQTADVKVRATAGSGENLQLITGENPEIELAIMQADVISEGIKRGQGSPGFGAIAGMYSEAVQIVARKDTGISSVRDLKGRKIGIGAANSGTEKNALLILEAYGLSKESCECVNLIYADATKAIQEGTIDAFFCTMGTPSASIRTLADNISVTLLQVSGEEARAVTDAYSYYEPYTIPAGTYAGQEQAVETIGVKSVLVASDSLNDDIVKKITQSLFEHAQELQYAVSVEYEPIPDEAVKDLPVALHEGAKAWYEQNGIDVPD